MVSVLQIATDKLPSQDQMLTMHIARMDESGISCLMWGSDCVRMEYARDESDQRDWMLVNLNFATRTTTTARMKTITRMTMPTTRTSSSVNSGFQTK